MAIETLTIPAKEIEYGDRVHTREADFWAYSKAELDQWGDVNVNNGQKYVTFVPTASVQVEREVKAEEYSYN